MDPGSTVSRTFYKSNHTLQHNAVTLLPCPRGWKNNAIVIAIVTEVSQDARGGENTVPHAAEAHADQNKAKDIQKRNSIEITKYSTSSIHPRGNRDYCVCLSVYISGANLFPAVLDFSCNRYL